MNAGTTVLDRLTGRRTAAGEPQVLPDDAPAENVRAHLSDRQLALNRLRGDLDHVEQRIADSRAAKLLGETIDMGGLAELGERQATLLLAIADVSSEISGLQGRVDAWDKRERLRRYAAVREEMTALSAAAPAIEDRFGALAREITDLVQAMRAASRRYDVLESEASRIERADALVAKRERRPSVAPLLPESFFTRTDPPISFDQWWGEWKENHR